MNYVKRFVLLVALTAAGYSQQLNAQTGPKLIGDGARAECRIAFDLAKATFASTNPNLLWPILLPEGTEASIVLSRGGDDISGGLPLYADATAFDRVEYRPGSANSFVYWQRETNGGRRLVVVQDEFNWRGAWYYLFDVEGSLSQSDFILAYTSARRSNLSSLVVGVPVLGDNRWQPPIILGNPQTKDVWVLDQGERGNGLTSWSVYVSSLEGMNSPCQIEFANAETVGLKKLPRSVRNFAALLDEALGPGTNEGTLNQTGAIRFRVAQSWAVLTERPWALVGEPHNSRKQVDDALIEWGRSVPARMKLHKELGKTYDVAQRELAVFLVANFAISQKQAEFFSAYAMDHMLRTYFVFQIEDEEKRVSFGNPWPPDIR